MAVLSDQFGRRYDLDVFRAQPRQETQPSRIEPGANNEATLKEVREQRTVSFRSNVLFGNSFRPSAVLGC